MTTEEKQQVDTWYGQKKMNIIYGRMGAKEIRLLMYSLVMNLPAKMQPPLLDEMAKSDDGEIKDFTIKALEDMGY